MTGGPLVPDKRVKTEDGQKSDGPSLVAVVAV
jgi:hypothetical protein